VILLICDFFLSQDNLIAEDRFVYRVTGGCTVVVSLFICGKLFVSNAGDSRAVLCRGRKAFPLSNDFTPETERQRIRKLAALQPELLGGEYTALDFSRRPNRRDIGQRLLYREPHMTGWAYKTVTPEDLKFPVVYGEGKRSRVLATIGVTRGFGDHDLRAPNSSILIKPFLSSQPEVRIVP
jgi:protein phosphatase 1H